MFSCKGSRKDKIYKLGDKIRIGDLEVEIEKYDIRYPVLTNMFGDGFGSEPELAVFMKITNKSKKNFSYNPEHGSTSVKGISYPMIFPDGDEQKPLKIFASLGISKTQGQIEKKYLIEPDKSITDVFTYNLPPSETNELYMRIPGKLFNEKNYYYVSIPYVFTKPSLPPAIPMNELTQVGNLKIAVTDCKYENISYTLNGKKFKTPKPLLAIEIKIVNSTDKAIPYKPSHSSQTVNRNRPTLHYEDFKSIERYEIKANYIVESQVHGTKLIEPGQVLTDKFIFKVPEQKYDFLYLHIPGCMFAGDNIVRFKLKVPPYIEQD